MQDKALKSAEAFHQQVSLWFHVAIALPLAGFVYIFLEMKHNSLSPVITYCWLVHVINFGIVLISIAIIAYVYSTYKRQLESIRNSTGLQTKLKSYLTLSVRSYVALGALAALIVGGLFLTTSAVLIVAYVSLLFLLSLHRPTPRKYVADLGLEGAEKESILKKQPFPAEE